MTPQSLALVQSSWKQLYPIRDTAADLFYARLFQLDPRLRRLFKRDLRDQGEKLMLILDTAIRGLDHLDQLVPTVMALGRRHVGYGVRPEHFETVGDALLWTLRQGLGRDYTEDVEAAWSEVYGLLSAVMKTQMTAEPAAEPVVPGLLAGRLAELGRSLGLKS
jgi:hemoglobin-like flavoprotein